MARGKLKIHGESPKVNAGCQHVWGAWGHAQRVPYTFQMFQVRRCKSCGIAESRKVASKLITEGRKIVIRKTHMEAFIVAFIPRNRVKRDEDIFIVSTKEGAILQLNSSAVSLR